MNMRGGYFIKDDIRNFDNEFFGILNQEATYMDPQQRKLLEVVFECFETAGVTLDQISGSDTGCYVGNFGNVRISQYLNFLGSKNMWAVTKGSVQQLWAPFQYTMLIIYYFVGLPLNANKRSRIS